ncbi:N-methyl-L-tryptophan oxidase [Saccharopolyspora indica]|uniref:N-methyl-L-tryptophan oxidase n=1 Tax=Saccharopolyspora indica TaxID=1229659 RepID=UPI0022EB6956|nr:N-methyl-L-tryptophan oxidase [Saccharopolyspora indica]MDA3642570.1 N-methyl-L-tryptophan oxidase [Saccharopolyspora indica]
MKPVQQSSVAVIGVGTMGSQLLHRLAADGLAVTGFEQFDIGHQRGAAGGETRIFRVAYKEGGNYVPLLREARSAWQELSARAGVPMLEPCGAMTIGSAEDPDVRTVADVTERWGLDVERLDHREAARRFPQHRLFPDDVVLLDRQGGLLHPQRAIVETTLLAEKAGARLYTGTTVEDVVDDGNGVAVHFRRGSEIQVEKFDQAVVCTGPWITRSVPVLARDIEIRRAVLCWFETAENWDPERFPVGIRRSGGENTFSFFPDVGGGVKINLHVPKSIVDDPDLLDPVVAPDYVARVSAAVSRCLPGLPPRPAEVRTFMEGYTADNHGIIGRDPHRPNVLVMGGFSGHGFKLAPVFARAAAELLRTGRTDVPIDHLSLSRLR